MPARRRSLLVDRLETVEGWHDIEQCQAFDPVRMVAG